MNTTERERELHPGVLMKGYCIDLLNELEKELGFKAQLYVVEDQRYGAYNPNTKRWNGMIGDIYHGVRNIGLQRYLVWF